MSLAIRATSRLLRLKAPALAVASPNIFFRRHLDIHQFTNKEALEKERARLADEMNRGYFQDLAEFRKHGGKIGMANETLIPVATAKRFPSLMVEFNDGETCLLPLLSDNCVNSIKQNAVIFHPHITLLCLSFRANAQPMIDSWTSPFFEAFKTRNHVQIFEVSFIDSWLLSLRPIKSLLLRVMRKSDRASGSTELQRSIAYSFGDHYDLRKELNIINLLTGYIFLLDNWGRIRWRACGTASKLELSYLMSCASLLLEGQNKKS